MARLELSRRRFLDAFSKTSHLFFLFVLANLVLRQRNPTWTKKKGFGMGKCWFAWSRWDFSEAKNNSHKPSKIWFYVFS